MSVEQITYINNFDASQPAGSDRGGDAAAHIRGIKSGLLSTFPNINGPVTVKPADFGGFAPILTAMPYFGAVGDLPANWKVADGSSYTVAGVTKTLPDLRGKMIMGTSSTYALLATGGAESNTPTITVNGTSLSIAQMPSHNHGVNDGGHAHQINAASARDLGNPKEGTVYGANQDYAGAVEIITGGGQATTVSGANISIQYAGSGAAHSHSAYSTVVPTLPPYVVATWIVRIY